MSRGIDSPVTNVTKENYFGKLKSNCSLLICDKLNTKLNSSDTIKIQSKMEWIPLDKVSTSVT
jgi:hypothetical protein